MLLVTVFGIPILAFSESIGLGIFSAIVSVIMVGFAYGQAQFATDYGVRHAGISAVIAASLVVQVIIVLVALFS